MDIVITYVNGNDPIWKKDYEKYTNVPILEKRFRDWGTLKYLMRGIETKMPFIKNVYLVVSHTSQVPKWADTENLKIVLHKDIIPNDILPTFNANPIELHLHNIKGLAEEYIYFNDDIFPVLDCEPRDFFRDGKIVLRFTRHFFVSGMFKQITRNSDRAARKALGLKPSSLFLRPQHVCTPMLRSQCQEVYDIVRDELIRTSSTKTRSGENLNQYLFLDYMKYKGLNINEEISKKHFSLALATEKSLKKFLYNPTHKFVCINDVKLSEERYESLRTVLLVTFEEIFPNKSRFEK